MATFAQVETRVVSRSLVIDPPLSDEELERFCLLNGELRIERTSEGVIWMNPPTGGLTGNGNAEINRQLGNWWVTHEAGRIFDSSTGFFLPDGSLLSPDAAYASPEQLQGMTREELVQMPRLCPAFVIELLSPSDSLPATEKKMEQWIANGAQVGWLVDLFRRGVVVYRAGRALSFEDGDQVAGSGPVDGFLLELGKIWRRYDV